MKFIRPNVQIIEQAPGPQGIYDAICQAAATCYQSVPKSGESAKAFVDTLIKNGHLAMLEFGTVYLMVAANTFDFLWYERNKYSSAVCKGSQGFITTNYRVLIENDRLKDLNYLCEPTEYHTKRFTALFTISLGIARDFVRHRVFSFAGESTRYCNYSKDKFENQLTFILPSWSELPEGEYAGPLHPEDINGVNGGYLDFHFSWACDQAEKFYMNMIEDGASAQTAREVLPLATKTNLCMCGFEDDWRHFFDLRMRGTTGRPHPDAEDIATKLWKQFKENGINL